MLIAKNKKSAFKKDPDAFLQHASPRELLNKLIQQNPELMIEYVSEHHRDKVIDMMIRDQRKPIGFDQLQFRFIDTKGKQYFGFPKNMPIPIQRFGKMRDFETWMTVGVSPREFDMVIDACNKSWVQTLKTKKGHERVGLLLEELRMRREMVIHTDLLYNYLAVQWVRDDENPEKFDASIHDEKVEQFKKDTDSGNTYFFFRQPELEKLNELYKFTVDEWEAYWIESEQKQLFLKTAIQTVLLRIESEKGMKISTPD